MIFGPIPPGRPSRSPRGPLGRDSPGAADTRPCHPASAVKRRLVGGAHVTEVVRSAGRPGDRRATRDARLLPLRGVRTSASLFRHSSPHSVVSLHQPGRRRTTQLQPRRFTRRWRNCRRTGAWRERHRRGCRSSRVRRMSRREGRSTGARLPARPSTGARQRGHSIGICSMRQVGPFRNIAPSNFPKAGTSPGISQ